MQKFFSIAEEIMDSINLDHQENVDKGDQRARK
jgi:hypothetical protein